MCPHCNESNFGICTSFCLKKNPNAERYANKRRDAKSCHDKGDNKRAK